MYTKIIENTKNIKQQMETVDGGQQKQVDHASLSFILKKTMLKCHEGKCRYSFLVKHVTNDQEGNDSGWVEECCFLRRHVNLLAII